MATIFRNLFRNKKSNSQRDETPEFTDRDSARRSIRSSASKNHHHRQARFSDDHMLPATAAYHTTNAPKLRKGPQSCPGAYAPPEDEQPISRSNNNRSRPLPPPPSHHTQHPNSIASSSGGGSRRENGRDWETSEYGSESLSSPRHHSHHYQNYSRQNRNNHHRHYETRLDDEDDEEEEDMNYEHKNYQDLKLRYRRHYEDKLNDYECRRRDDRRRIKELEKEKQIIEKEKNDVVKIMIQQNEKMEKEKKKSDYYKRKMLEMEQQINQMRGGFAGFGVFPQTPQIFGSGAFGASSIGSGANSARFSSFLSNSIRPISSSNTPTTSAMDTSAGGGGAGESLVPTSDLSLIQIPPMPPILDLPQTVPTGGVIGANFAAHHHNEFEDIEEDEIKNFRTAETPAMSSIEIARISDISEGVLSFMEEKVEIKDEGYSTTPDDAPKV